MLSLIVTVSIPIVGFVIKQLYSRINEVKTDTKADIVDAREDYKERISTEAKTTKSLLHDEERRRNDAIGGVMNQVNQQYRDLKAEMHGVREDIKGLRDDK